MHLREELLAMLFFIACGCSRSASPSSDTPATESNKNTNPKPIPVSSYRYAGVEFAPPVGWNVEQVQGLILIMCPTIEADWQANISVEARLDPDERSLETALDAVSPELQKRKAEFREVDRLVAKRADGLEFARLEYTSRESAKLVLTEWEIIIKAPGEKRIFILASSSSELWQKYRPIFESFFQSAKLVNE